MPSRRQLLGWTLAGAGGWVGGQMLGRSAVTAGAVPQDWQEVRAQFAFAQAAAPRIPMNAANLAPPLQRVQAAARAAAEALDRDASFHHRQLFLQTELPRLRRLLERHLGVAAGADVALVRNTSEANSIIVNGLDLAAGDEVVLWDQNHHTNNRSWGYRRAQAGFGCRVVSLPEQPQGAPVIINAFLAALSPRTRVVSFSATSNISGLRLPCEELCAAIHATRPGIFVHVDGAQRWGAQRVDLARMDCDGFSASAHKWLSGPRELGILYVRRSWAGRIRPSTIGYDYAFDYPEQALPANAARFECLGQRDDARFPALAAAIEFQLALGPERIEARIAGLGRRLRDGLDAAGLRVISPRADALGHGIVVVDPGQPARAVALFRRLYERHGIYGAYVHHNRIVCDSEQLGAAADRLAIRLCPHIYNSEQDVDLAVAVLGGDRNA